MGRHLLESRVLIRFTFKRVFLLKCFLFAFAQIGKVSGPSHQNRSLARGSLSGKNISAQPCVEVKFCLC